MTKLSRLIRGLLYGFLNALEAHIAGHKREKMRAIDPSSCVGCHAEKTTLTTINNQQSTQFRGERFLSKIMSLCQGSMSSFILANVRRF